MSRIVRILRTGLLDYEKSLKLQQFICSESYNSSIKDYINFKNTLILTEHLPVYTIGIRTKNYSEKDEYKLKELGAQFFKTNRGGLITFHGPGQLIAYPILHLKQFKPSMRWYVNQLESTVIDCCQQFNLLAGRTQDTGIWVNDKKICAIGVHGKMYVTSHGIGLNCSTDLEWFNHIVPCGIEGKGVTSLSEELGILTQIEEVIPKFLESFQNNFDCELLEINENECSETLRLAC